jgi:hypothetical protein
MRQKRIQKSEIFYCKIFERNQRVYGGEQTSLVTSSKNQEQQSLPQNAQTAIKIGIFLKL